MWEVIPVNKKNAYRAVPVKDVDLKKVLAGHEGEPVVVGLDVGKEWIYAVTRFGDGAFHRPWVVANPGQIRLLVGLLEKIGQQGSLTVALESTGTYADALRQSMSDAELNVHRVGSKASHDWSETFDGVPSQHDGKDAAVVADLCGLGKSVPWPMKKPAEWEQQLGYWVRQMDAAHRMEQMWIGRLESRLTRYWPEAGQTLKLSSATLLKAIDHWGSPAALGADPQAAATLRRFGRWVLKEQVIQRLVHEARQSVGVRMEAWDLRELRECARRTLVFHREKAAAVRELRRLAETHELLPALAPVVGLPTACVLWACLGDPRNYTSGPAYRKGMGLNLTERSSGKYKGQLRISKRGKSLPRRFLYFAALRYVMKEPVRNWYQQKKKRDGDEGMRGIVAVMRKLPLAVYAAAQGAAFDANRLFQSIARDAERRDAEKGAKK